MIYLNLTTKAKKKKKKKKKKNESEEKLDPQKGKKMFVVVFVWTAGWFLCSSRGFVYLSFFYIFPPLMNALFSVSFLKTKYRVLDLLHRLTFALVPSLKSRCRSLMKLIFICFASFVIFLCFLRFHEKKTHQTYYWSHMPKWINTGCAL